MSGLVPAFQQSAGELGLWSAARLFVNAAFAAGGLEAIQTIDDALGDDHPVLEHVAQQALTTQAPVAPPPLDAVIDRCAGLRRIVVVAIEAEVLAVLVERLPADVDLIAIPDTMFPADRARLEASWTPRVRLTDLGAFQGAGGARSALLTPVYGADDFHAVVTAAWVRAHSRDVRLQFRRLIGVNLVGPRMAAYPRWLSETDRADFTDLVEAR